MNKFYFYSWYWSETSLQWWLIQENITKKRFMSFVFEDSLHTPVSLNCKLVSVPYREYKNGILTGLLLQIRTLAPKFVIDKRKVQKSDRINSDRQSGSDQLRSSWIMKKYIKLNEMKLLHI